MSTKIGSGISKPKSVANLWWIKIWSKGLKTRGRRREARRWMAENKRLHFAIVFPNGVRNYLDPDRFGRTFRERSDAASIDSERRRNRLKARDPALHATMMELMWEDNEKYLAMSPEQRDAQRERRLNRYRRESRRAERLKRAQRRSG